jgi:hypothetical protein
LLQLCNILIKCKAIKSLIKLISVQRTSDEVPSILNQLLACVLFDNYQEYIKKTIKKFREIEKKKLICYNKNKKPKKKR